MKQTASEWLCEEFKQFVIAQDVMVNTLIIQISFDEFMDLKNKAIAMEKEQMIEFAKYTSVIDTEKFDMKKVIDFYLTLDGEEFVEDKSE
jgi:hypothetical protein